MPLATDTSSTSGSALGNGWAQRAISFALAASVLAGGLAALGGCEEEEIRATTRNLIRPGPTAMICASRDEQGRPTGRRLADCTPGGDQSASTAPTLFGLTVNVGRGDVALFRTTSEGEPLVDLDPGPGFGFIPVGTQPSALGTSDDGCLAVTANHGSCDLSIIDVPALFNAACRASALPEFDDLEALCGVAGAAAGGLVSTVTPHTAAGPLQARPQDVLIVPGEGETAGEGSVCDFQRPYRAYVTFPGCNLIAEIDLKTGRIQQALRVTAEGFEPTDQPVCPHECSASGVGGEPSGDARVDEGADTGATADAGDDLAADAADMGMADGGGDGQTDATVGGSDAESDQATDSNGGANASAVGVLPYRLALRASGDQLYVSSAAANFISVVGIDAAGAFVAPHRIVLEGSATRTTAIAVSPPSAALGEFVYAVAQDRTVRVVSVAQQVECEAAHDLGLVEDEVSIERAACFPVGETPRQALATSPGISFGSGLPRDVVFTTVTPADVDKPTSPAALPLDGVFALVALSDGRVAVVDVEDRAFVTSASQSLPKTQLPHRLRNALLGITEDADDSGVLAVGETGKGGVPVVVSALDGQALPGEGVYLRSPGQLSPGVRFVYERLLVERFSAQLVVEGDGLYLADRGASFCAAGVLGRVERDGRFERHGDIVELVGCDSDADCGVRQVCRKPVARQGDTGLCLDADRQDDLFTQCSPWLRGEREFLVRRAGGETLAMDVLPSDPQPTIPQPAQPDGGCKSNADCEPYFLCALDDREIVGSPGFSVRQGECFRPGCLPGDSDFECPGDSVCLTPLDGSPAVCASVPPPIEPWPVSEARVCDDDDQCGPQVAPGGPCEDDRDCGDDALECRRPDSRTDARQCLNKGLVCADFPGLDTRRCIRPSPCFNELQHYTVRAGRSMIASGGLHRVFADDDTSECIPDATADPLLQARIPIGMPVLPVVVGPVCEATPSPLELPQPNPCVERIDQSYGGFVQKQSETVFTWLEEPAPATVIRYANPSLWMSIGTSHMTRPAEDLDALDQSTGLPAMPERNMTIDVLADSQYSPLLVRAPGSGSDSTSSLIVLPFALVPSPDGYVYVSDGGDQSGTTGNRGQVLRFDAVSARLEDETVYVVR